MTKDLIVQETIEQKIYLIRGQKVMIVFQVIRGLSDESSKSKRRIGFKL